MKKRTLRTTAHRLGFGVLVSVLLLLAGCSKDENPNRLPDGKYPMTFTAQVEGLTAEKAATRATVDNSWTGGEEVAVQVDGSVKKYTVASGGALTVSTPNDPHYWTNNTMTVQAWHQSTYSGTRPTTFSVEANQSGDGYQQSDMLYASQAVTFQNSALAFKHLPVKVVVNLKNGDGVTEGDVQGATVSIENQATTSGTIAADWSVTQATSGNTSIAPNVLGTAASGYQKSVQALLVPQQSTTSTKFIKVAVGSQEFYYSTTLDFAVGQQHTYNITVLKSGITVTASGATEWTGTTTNVTSKEVTIFTASDLKIGDYYYSDGNTSDGGLRKRYADGTFVKEDVASDLTGGRTVVGIVYWVGDPTNATNGDPLLKTQHSGCTHGLVVALQDAGSNSLWSSSYEDITSNWLSNQSTTYGITSLKEHNKMQGYANTQALIDYNASDRATGNNSDKKVLPIEAITTTYAAAHPAPARSSGWYFPSVMELKYMCCGQGNSSGTAGRDFLNTQLGKVLGASSLQSNRYWSSTENVNYWAWGVLFNRGEVYSSAKHNDSCGVRAVAAF